MKKCEKLINNFIKKVVVANNVYSYVYYKYISYNSIDIIVPLYIKYVYLLHKFMYT